MGQPPIEGFSVEEIAVITDRASQDVVLSVARARENLHRFTPIANRYKEKWPQALCQGK